MNFRSRSLQGERLFFMLPNPWFPPGAAVFLMSESWVIPCACSHAAFQQETRLLTEQSIIRDRHSDSSPMAVRTMGCRYFTVLLLPQG
ncbi:hypothetical protein HMPREF3038_00349 [Akkermansia sp. KLE1797]|nr:hypothetical protein HMPREF3038_00349 [Akkermansia sp. KLE1797]KXU55057.1 hypothetical protein HMPREF3039_00782 [Akkermansia sp. KLE1798]KZA04311.1 hypothetical protein HMPREF1326_01979 [Akkermansia sp. KLE1605]